MSKHKPTKKKRVMKKVRRKHPIARRTKAMPKKKKLKRKLPGHGFIPEHITPEQWVLGSARAIEGPVLMPGGHGWKKYLPARELQNKNGLETMNCTNYGNNNNWETLAEFHGFEDFPKNASERYAGVLTGTTKRGNSPHKAAEIIRQVGFIDEKDLPFDESIKTWKEYYSPKPMSKSLLRKGEQILNRFEPNHDWVFVGGSIKQKQEKMKYALQYSTLGVSVVAWKERNGKFFKEKGETDNHWAQLYDFEEGVCWWIYDHYDKVHKQLEWDYDFGFAKRFSLKRRVPGELSRGWITRLIEALKRFFKNVIANAQ